MQPLLQKFEDDQSLVPALSHGWVPLVYFPAQIQAFMSDACFGVSADGVLDSCRCWGPFFEREVPLEVYSSYLLVHLDEKENVDFQRFGFALSKGSR